MTRRSYGVSGPNNPAKPVSANWFNDLNELLSNGIAAMPQDFYEATDANMGPAFSRAITHLTDNASLNVGSGGGKLFVPKSNTIYDLGSTTLDLTSQVELCGAGPASSILRWQNDVTGIRVQRYNTQGATGTTLLNTAGDNSVIRDITLYGTGSTTLPYGSEAECHGIQMRAAATVKNVKIYNFKGDGIHIYANAGGGAGSEGNANLFRIEHVTAQGCRNGLYVNGADVNAGTVIGFNATSNRRWGIWDSSYLGNTYIGCHSDANALYDGGLSVCSYNGNLYAVNHGQDADASTNAPTGTTESNFYWIYLGPGAAINGYGRRAWVSGMTWRSGGAYCSDDINGQNVFVGCYSEGGQAPSQMNYPAVIHGGLHGASVYRIGYGTFYGGWLTCASIDGIEVVRDFKAGKDIYIGGTQLVVNGTKVIGEQGAAVAADATDLASAITLLNQLKARMRTHGLIA